METSSLVVPANPMQSCAALMHSAAHRASRLADWIKVIISFATPVHHLHLLQIEVRLFGFAAVGALVISKPEGLYSFEFLGGHPLFFLVRSAPPPMLQFSILFRKLEKRA